MSLFFAIALAGAPSASPACPADDLRKATLEATTAAWLDRFNALDLPCFLRFFAPDATMFAPFSTDGRSRRIEAAELPHLWREHVFDAARADGRTTLNVQPRDLSVVRLGKDGAMLTFHLSGDANPNRRTLVWRRDRAGWRIVHVHASRIQPERAAAQNR